MRAHFSLHRGIAVACAVAGTAAMLNGNCSAQSFIAADYATNSTYAAGWTPSDRYNPGALGGQNGGYGFGPWTTYGTEAGHPYQHALDRTSAYDPFGVAWTLFNPEGTRPNSWPNDDSDATSAFFPNSPGTCMNGPKYTDLSRAGRAVPNGIAQLSPD